MRKVRPIVCYKNYWTQINLKWIYIRLEIGDQKQKRNFSLVMTQVKETFKCQKMGLKQKEKVEAPDGGREEGEFYFFL
jgi:hypothetical protein